MIRKLLLTLGMIILFSSLAVAQSGTIKGVVTDQNGGALEFANVYLKKEGNIVNYAMTNEKGEYALFGVSAGTYDLEADASALTSCGKKQTKSGIRINNGATMFEDIVVDCNATILEGTVIKWKPPVFDAGTTESAKTLDNEQIRKTPGRSVTNALASTEGVTSVDGSMTSVRGARSTSQQIIIDGMVARGLTGVSMASIEQAELIQGGIPAEYGDGTSFTVITTRGAPNSLHGSIELMGSLDGYNNFLVAGSLMGPILKGKDKKDPARIGFLLTADYSYDKDGRPLQGGSWRATDEAIDYLIKNPLRYSATQFSAYYNNGEYLNSDYFRKQRVRDNAEGWNYLLQGKLDFVFGEHNNINLSLGGMYECSRGRNWGISSALFDANNNSQSQSTTWRVNARFNHRITPDSSSVFNNIMYNINVNFTKTNSWTRDIRHKDNIFNYGHIGYYKTTKAKYFRNDSITIDGITRFDMRILTNIYDSIVAFSATPFGSNDESLITNPDLLAWVTNFTEVYTPEVIYENLGNGFPYDLNLYSTFGSLRNGDSPSSIYSLFTFPGAVTASNGKSEETQIGANANLSLGIKNHDIKLGYIFEKRTSRSFSVAPYTLWTRMRDLANAHISELDLENPILVGEDTVMYNLLYDEGAQSTFDRRLRAQLGLDPHGTDWIDIDNMSPDEFSLSLFSPEELFDGGNILISYYGYDYTGSRKYKKPTNINDFFTAEKDGDKLYNIGAYEPIYMAMYIQDKFSIRTMLFNVGLRVDRFDANQYVLSDPYLFRDAYKVGEIRGSFDDRYIPTNATDDWVVYVNQVGTLDPDNTSIVGFRSGNTWYDAGGAVVTDPTTILGATGGPILKTPVEQGSVSVVEGAAFTKYEPQWSIMPRLSFSFNVSGKSLFYAHYNIITSRPYNLRLDPISYLWIDKYGSNSGSVINNPNLKPEKSVDYEIGFRQAIGENSAISLAAYYSEKRDQIQCYRFTGAYPTTYYSYDNIDFGTVQGFTVGYDLQRTKNVTLRASYTLQFAKGTGSSATSSLAIIASGQPNLRTLNNLSFDQRHKLAANLDYRFGYGTDYDGPKTKKQKKDGTVKEIRWLENAGININFSAGSGFPYSRSSKPYSIYVSGTKSQLSGTINGSNMPWIYQCDVRIDKSFVLALKKNEKGMPVKQGFINVYLEVMNIFNFKNVLYVYEYTGNADDDGYLTATEYQQQINSQVDVASYSNYYRMRMMDPYNYSMPTRVRLGIQFQF